MNVCFFTPRITVPLVSIRSPALKPLQVSLWHASIDHTAMFIISLLILNVTRHLLINISESSVGLNSKECNLLTPHTVNYLPLLSTLLSLCVSQISPTHSAPALGPLPSSPLPSPPVTPSAAPQEVRLKSLCNVSSSLFCNYRHITKIFIELYTVLCICLLWQ